MSDANNEDIVITITDVEATKTAAEQEPEGEEANKGEKRKREVKVRSKFGPISPRFHQRRRNVLAIIARKFSPAAVKEEQLICIDIYLGAYV